MFMGKEWPSLTELFFGKDNGPQGKMVDTGKYPNGMTKKNPVVKKMTVSEQMQAELEPIPDWPANDGRIDAIGQNGNDGLHYEHINQEAQDEIAVSTGKEI